MGNYGLFVLKGVTCLSILFLLGSCCMASLQTIGRLKVGFKGSQMNFIDNNGLFLVSNNSNFGFGFTTTQDVTLFLLVVVHISSSTVVWSANRGSPVRNNDLFTFDDNGDAYLQTGGSTIWSTNTGEKGVIALELQDSGNVVLLGSNGSAIWQSFDHPANSILSNQEFRVGSKLVSNPNSNNLTYSLEIRSGDVILSASFQPPQPYWAMGTENRRTIDRDAGDVNYAVLLANSWKFYDQNKILLWQFIFSDNTDSNATWVAVLGDDGFITFNLLHDKGTSETSPTKIPQNECSRPAACDPYYVCYSGNKCQCPSGLPSCKLGNESYCNKSKDPVTLASPGDGLNYFATGFVPPSSKTNIEGCKSSCINNCSCLAVFFEMSSGNCFMFDQIGSLQGSNKGPGYASFIKVSTSAVKTQSGSNKHVPLVIAIVLVTVVVILCLVYTGVYFHRKERKKLDEVEEDKTSEEDNFLEGLAGMPLRFSYKDLQDATDNFSIKLGQGGFGSVYQGTLRDGTKIAVKKLEGIGQGKKEFRAEVGIIGSIHHLHLVRLKGFCAQGNHRLLAYEFMSNGSLEKWLFKKEENSMLDWDTRYTIAVGTAKGLAYLHEDCDVKIVHCDIKPENVLLDDNFSAKVSDFGLAKLMNREQSFVFTTMRGTRGYLAPEWITSYAISEKSDVYSYGMLLLEIIGGRKNYDASLTSEKSHFPTFAFKMMEEGKLKEIIDSTIEVDQADERVSIASKVALWCIQDDMHLRPPMTKVVQMLEGLSPVPPPPTSQQVGSRLYSNFFKSISEEGTSSGPSDCNSDAYLSAVRLSGPR